MSIAATLCGAILIYISFDLKKSSLLISYLGHGYLKFSLH